MAQQGKRSRRRQDAAVSEKLNPLRERLAELDVDKAERERRQEAALTAYAEAAVERDRIAAQAESEVERLQEQIQQVRRQATAAQDATEQRQAEALWWNSTTWAAQRKICRACSACPSSGCGH
jgi:chromosome segregation ATPase